MALFTVSGSLQRLRLEVLLIQRDGEPFKGSWALPGALCAGLYFAMSYPLARVAARLEARLADAEEPVVQAVTA